MTNDATLLAFVAIGAASRTAMLLPMIALKPARKDGLGRSATLTLGAPTWGALAITLALCALTGTWIPAASIAAAAFALALTLRTAWLAPASAPAGPTPGPA